MGQSGRETNRIWFDTEFYDNGKTIELISIGMVKANGNTLYLESSDIDLNTVGDWVKENVVPKLQGIGRPKSEIAEIVRDFVGFRPEIISYYSSYDWVVLCQLYGGMMQLPKSWPFFCIDIKQISYLKDDLMLPGNTNSHNALDDALWIKSAWKFLQIQELVK